MQRHTIFRAIRVRCGSCVAAITLLFALALTGDAWAVVRSAPSSPIKQPESNSSVVQPAGVTQPAGIQPAGATVQPAPIKPTGTPGASGPKFPEPDANDNDIERLRKLEAIALSSPRKGSAAERTAGRTAWLLGLIYLHGENTPVDRATARKWFERARQLNEPMGNAGLAWCEIDGCNGPPAPSMARPYLAALRNANSGLALYLEWLIQERAAPVQHSAAPAQELHSNPDAQRMQLLQRAAQAGNTSALNELALGNVAASRYDLAMSQFNAAAKRSPAAASNAHLLGIRIQSKGDSGKGATGRKDPAEWYEQARRYHRGDGVPSNYAEAVRLYQLAAAGGNQPARRMLELIYSRPAPGGVVNIAWMRQLASMDVTAEGAILTFTAPPTPVLYVRDLTPLYEFIPDEWRKERAPLPR